MAATQNGNMAAGSLAMLEQSLAGAESAMAKTQEQATLSLDTLFGAVQNQLQQGAETRESKSASAARKVIEATFQTAREDMAAKAKDLFEWTGNLEIFMKSFGIELSQLDKPTQDDVARIQAAENAVIKAGNKWLGKEKAIANAKALLEQVQNEVKAAIRKRLMNTSTEQTLATFQLIVNNISGRLEARIQEIDQQKKAITARKAIAINIKQKAAEALSDQRKQKEKLQAMIIEAQDILSSMEHGTQEYVAQDAVISKLKEQFDTVSGNVDIAYALLGDKELYVNRLEEHESGQTGLLSSHKTFLTLLKSQTEERVQIWRSTLSALQSAKDLEIAKTLHDSGRKIDDMTDEMMAQVVVAVGRAKIEMFEDLPNHLRNLVNICGATNKMAKEFSERRENSLNEMANFFGIDRSQLNRFGSIDATPAT